MIGLVCLRELQDHVISLRFQLSLVVLVLLFALSGVIYVYKHTQILSDSAMIEVEDNRRFEEMATLGNVLDGFHVGGSRMPTEFITEGGANWFNDAFWVSSSSEFVSTGTWHDRYQNNLLRRYDTVDWTFLVRIVISFLCIVLAYDTFSGEHERGTLRSVLANPLSRVQLLIGKTLAHLLVLLAAVSLGAIVSLAVMSLGNAVQLDAGTAVGVLLFLAGTTVYGLLFLLLAAAVSALTRQSASSLVVLLLLWAVLIVMIPQTSYLIATSTIDGTGRWWDGFERAANETRQRLQREGVVLRGREEGAVDNYALERRYAAAMEDALREDERNVHAIYGQQLAQYLRARSINMMSPGFTYQYAVETLLGAGVIRNVDLMEQVWQYRQTVRDFVRETDAADPDSPHVLYLSDYLSTREFDPETIPRFQQRELSLAEALAAGRAPVLLLLAEALLAFALAAWSVNRMRVAG